jgi:hypothetical protein
VQRKAVDGSSAAVQQEAATGLLLVLLLLQLPQRQRRYGHRIAPCFY